MPSRRPTTSASTESPLSGFERMDTALSPPEEIVEAARQGKMVILVDSEDRENEGDLIMAAEKVTPEAVNFLTKEGRGLICVPLTPERCEELDLVPMTRINTSKMETAFSVSVDLIPGTTTGISAFDRSATIRALAGEKTKPEDLGRPGHIFPLRAAVGGVLRRAGHTEAAVDIARMAGLMPAGLLCEIMSDDGSMALLPELIEIARKHDLPLISIADLIEFRRQRETLIDEVARATLPTRYGTFDIRLFEDRIEGAQHVALSMGDPSTPEPVLTRVHSQCLTGDVFGSLRCDCGDQTQRALKRIGMEGRGVFLYMRQEGRGIGLANKLRAYHLQENGLDTVEANLKLGFKPDLRNYGIGAQILRALGVRKIRLLTNNPRKIVGLQAFDLEVVERVPHEVEPNEVNAHYLSTKKRKLGHLLDRVEMQEAASDAKGENGGQDR